MDFKSVIKVLLFSLLLLLFSSCTTATGNDGGTPDGPVPLLGMLSGDLPVTALSRLPVGQQDQPVGYLNSQQQLDAVLPLIAGAGKALPKVDFTSQIVLFSRNTVFYNRLSIGQVSRSGATLRVLAMETMSARPIEDKVAISLVVIERNGARYIEGGEQKITIGD